MMQLRWMIVALAAVSTVPISPVWPQSDPIGTWHGALVTPMGSLTMVVTIAAGPEGSLTGSLRVPEQMQDRSIALSSLSSADGRFAFAVPSLNATWTGVWDDGDERWTGMWVQGATLPLDLKRGLPEARPVIEGLDGRWEGTVERNAVKLRLVLHVYTGPFGTVVGLDSPDMAAFGVPVADVSRSGDSVRFHVPVSRVHYSGAFADGGTRLTGIWRAPDRPDARVTFTRVDTSAGRRPRSRPQEPEEPFPYRADTVRFANPRADGVSLAGTLTLPPGEGPFPAAVLISGSGPQDRDETLMGHRPFLVLADYLTRHGVAVLRYDDRGFAESSGDHGAATSADFATDANAAVTYLLTRPEIDHDAIGLVGHSEGGLIGPLATVANDRVAYLVMLAGPGTNTAHLLRSQQRLMALSQGVSDERLSRARPVIDSIIAAVRPAADHDDAAARVRAVLTPSALDALGAPASEREELTARFARDWFRYFLRYDASAVLSRVRVPVLAINGSLDIQVPADENLAAIRAALAGNPDVTVRKLEGLNHLFQTARTGALGEYADIEETFAPAALTLVADWITARFGRSAKR